MSTTEREKLFILDGNSFCYRAYYAIRGLSNSKGMPTNAIYGFVNMLNKIIKEEKPTYLAVAFDMKGPTFRHRLFEEYKIKRPPMPKDLQEQMEIIKEIIEAYNIPIFEQEGYEADDVMATMVERLKNPRLLIYLVTADKDVLQLIEEGIFVYNPYHGDNPIYDFKAVMERFGAKPAFIPDFLALSGDVSDNIPGISGVGEKTAKQLLERFHTIDNLLSHTTEIEKESLRQIIEREKERIVLNRRLVLLNRDLPLQVKLEDLSIKPPDKSKLFRLFKELEFKQLIKELFREGSGRVEIKLEKITTDKEWVDFEELIKREGKFSFSFTRDKLFSLKSIYIGCRERVFFIPLAKNEQGVEIGKRKIAQIFSDDSLVKICYDLKQIRNIFDKNGITIKGYIFDIMLASYLLNPSTTGYTLPDIILEYLETVPPFSEEGEEIYNQEVVKLIFRLFPLLETKLIEKKLIDLYTKIELPLVDVLLAMEKKGVYIDINFLKGIAENLEKNIREIKKEIFQISEQEFNLDSPKQMREILFNKLKLPVIKKVKTGASTDEEVLIKLAELHRLPKLILDYREIAKLKSTYVENFLNCIDRETQRIHTTFSQVNTETGRLSSSNPNLQNIPIKTEIARQIRKAISVPDKKHILLSADYSQIELRILAHLSGDEVLIEAFRNGMDIHLHTASLIFSLPMDKITPQMRSLAKTINFGIIYGMSPYGLSKELNIKIEEAEKFITAYFMRYPRVKTYMEEKIREAREKGYVTTLLNRRRYIPYINSSYQTLRQFSERTAINTPVQGSAADIIKLAMLNLYKKITLQGIRASLILQIHDELLFELDKELLTELKELVKKEMESVIDLKVPLKVSLKAGYNWLEMESIN
ncbi:MAG: DNA polymerase I [Candidatus Omnitrophica bacterium]|nr:DNA polymerase I [Candidatus Omnitrophota bacterium]